MNLNELPKTLSIEKKESPTLLFPDECKLYFTPSGNVKTVGLGNLDKKEKDLISIIDIIDPINVRFKNLNLYSPRVYAESLSPIAPHISVQGIIITQFNGDYGFLDEINSSVKYDKHDDDLFRIGSTKINQLKKGDYLIVMNRRVGGWDGSIDRPVIELLGAGGHIPTIEKKGELFTLPILDTIKKEAEEELGLRLENTNLHNIGGFHNKYSNELVILYGIEINSIELPKILKKALNNITENIDGIYAGEIKSVMKKYLDNATYFAGGEQAKSFNFPSNKTLMEKLYQYISNKS